MKKNNNVYRIDIEATSAYPNRHPTHGWQVRIRRQGTQHTKFFSDERSGGRQKALEAAIAYRDDLLKELPEPADSVLESAKARSKTGVIGLNFCNKDDGSGKRKPYIQLSWLTPQRQRKSASYSVDKWGLRRAVWNAVVRLQREKEDPSFDVGKMFHRAYQQILKQEPHLADEDTEKFGVHLSSIPEGNESA
ncbi:MAG TPA: AP2 domain-containing protein [Rhodothermales bacterium]|nr:AP2 domain-containing protein [Rhodothermales bacterium]